MRNPEKEPPAKGSTPDRQSGIKHLVGQRELQAPRTIDFKPTGRLIVTTSHLPEVEKGSSFWRRVSRDEIDGATLDEDDPPFYYDTYAEAEPDELL